MMSSIRGKNTKPEWLVRRGLHAKGFRYRLHVKELPGKPDLVLPKYKAAIFVHGCFWHGHDCPLFRWPSTREEFWREKIRSNVGRDARNVETLLNRDWRVATVWECGLRRKGGAEIAVAKISAWLISGGAEMEFKE
jgi:DNA mismatch endonuclease (patch repair protein)